MTLEELEAELGPPDDFIPNQKSRPLLSKWALAIGLKPVEVYAMNGIELANLYHERGSRKSTELQKIAADIFLRLHETIVTNKVDPDFMRGMIREEIENLPTRKIEIITPSHQIILDGAQHKMTETIIRIVAMGHPVMMVGPAGCGKTTIGQQTSTALQLPFYITSAINDTHELTGFVDGHGIYQRTAFRNAFEFGGIWVADEIDAWEASPLLAANSALANGYMTFPDNPNPITRHVDFRMVATANTFGNGADRVYIGRTQLDAASLDRFATVSVDYDLDLERMYCNGNREWLTFVWSIREKVQKLKIRHVVSSRAIIMGAAALSAGIARSLVEEIYLFKGLSAKDREKINDD